MAGSIAGHEGTDVARLDAFADSPRDIITERVLRAYRSRHRPDRSNVRIDRDRLRACLAGLVHCHAGPVPEPQMYAPEIKTTAGGAQDREHPIRLATGGRIEYDPVVAAVHLQHGRQRHEQLDNRD